MFSLNFVVESLTCLWYNVLAEMASLVLIPFTDYAHEDKEQIVGLHIIVNGQTQLHLFHLKLLQFMVLYT